jgi:hypothetical protein
MGRKKIVAATEPVAYSDMRGVNLKLAPVHHKLLRRVSAELEMSMSTYTAKALIERIEADAVRLGIRAS